jgi:hypothetical protein
MSTTFLSRRSGLATLRVSESEQQYAHQPGQPRQQAPAHHVLAYHDTRARAARCALTLKALLLSRHAVFNLVSQDIRTLTPDQANKVLLQRGAIGTCLRDIKNEEDARAFTEGGGLAIVDACLDVYRHEPDEGQLYLLLVGLRTILQVRKGCPIRCVPIYIHSHRCFGASSHGCGLLSLSCDGAVRRRGRQPGGHVQRGE